MSSVSDFNAHKSSVLHELEPFREGVDAERLAPMPAGGSRIAKTSPSRTLSQ